MPVAVRTYAQWSIPSGTVTLSWPSGTSVGDVAILHVGVGDPMVRVGPSTGGWQPVTTGVWTKTVTAADVGSQLTVTGAWYKLVVLTGAAAVGRWGANGGVTVTAAGSGVWLSGARRTPGIAPATYRVGNEFVDKVGYSQAQFFMAVGAGFQQLPGIAVDATVVAFEVVPVGAPPAPVVTAPLPNARVAKNGPVTVSWTPQGASPQTGYRVRVTKPDGVVWLDAAGRLVDSTEVTVASSATTATILPGYLAIPEVPSTTATIAVSTQTAAGWGPYSPEVPFSADPAPGVIGQITVASPAQDLTPVVSWTGAAGYGTLTGYRVWITGAAATDPTVNPVWDSGYQPGTATSITAPATTAWTNGQALRAWVGLWQTGGVSSLTSGFDPFTVTWTQPAPPASVVAQSAIPVRVTVTGVTSGDQVQIEQQLDGATWTPLTTVTATTTTITVTSVLATTGAPVTFRARRTGAVIDGIRIVSGWATSNQVTAIPDGSCWLVDDTDRASVLRVNLAGESPWKATQGVAVSYGLGADRPRVDRTQDAGWAGDLTLRTDTLAELDILMAWLRAKRVFWVAFPPDAGVARRPLRVVRSEALTTARVVQASTSQARIVTVGWVEQ